MFTHILVPLDGSPVAEQALTVAARVARSSHGTIVLMQAVGIPVDYSPYAYGGYTVQSPVIAQEALDAQQAKARTYLESIRQSAVLAGIGVETRIAIGTAAMSIENVSGEEQIDLVVMCSHGDTGFKRWVLGSVAQQVARHATIPVLVLHRDGTVPDKPFPDRLRPLRSIVAMVALDGSPFAEVAIEPAAQLVSALSAPAQGTLLLTKVVPSQAIQVTDATPDELYAALDKAQAYLNSVAQAHMKLAERYKIALLTSVAAGDNVAEALIRAAEEGQEAERKRLSGGCDLLALTTHGRSGLQRMTMGSVTERVLGTTKLPLLIVHNTNHHLKDQ